MHPIAVLFLAALLTSLLLRGWLAWRQIQHVRSHREQVPAEFSNSIPLETHHKAADYTVAKTSQGTWAGLADAALVVILTVGGGIAALDAFWRGWFSGDTWSGLALAASVMVLGAVVDLPFVIWRTFGIEARYGFNRMTWGLFLSDLAKQMLLGVVLGLPLLYAALWLMQAMGTYWWFYLWLVWISFNLTLLAIYPTWIAPLFNRFSPLEDDSLRARIEALLQKCGFRSNGLFVMDGSRRSSHGNAYFTGFGANKRIVFFDTLLNSLSPLEIEAVLAHELGHFRRRHVLKRLVWSFGMSLLLLAVLGYAAASPEFYQAFGLPAPSAGAALVLFFMVLPPFMLPLQPLLSLYSRRHEFEADRYAAEQSDAQALVSALVKLYKDNASTLTPDPLYSAFYDSHPPAAIRIAHLQKPVHNS